MRCSPARFLDQDIIHLFLAILVFGMKLVQIHWAGTILTFLLTAVCFMSIGILSAVLLPSSLFLFRLALKKAKKDGSLTHY
jgi:hypothetical protein